MLTKRMKIKRMTKTNSTMAWPRSRFPFIQDLLVRSIKFYGPIERIRARRVNVQVPELHIGEACNGRLKMVPGINVLKVYWISTWFNTKFGASGSALGVERVPAPAVPQPDEVQVSQFEICAAPVPFTPDPDELVFI